MTKQRLTFLFDRYVNRTISENEKVEFFRAIADAEHDDELRLLIDELWMSIPDNGDEKGLSHDFHNGVTSSNGTGTRWLTRLRIAASLSLIAVVASVLYFVSPTGDTTELAPTNISSQKPHDSYINLPDGSNVVLRSGSFLHYPNSFEGQTNRIVKLEGEAYFDIHHDAAHPFIVVSGNVITTVLGTAFNIKAFPKDKEVTVTVSRGKVEVTSDKKLVGVLSRDQQLTIRNRVAEKKLVDAREAITWIEADIFFNDITLHDALEELSNRFDVEIIVTDDRARDCRFSGTFINGETIEQILLVVCEFNNVTLTKNTQTGVYEISGAGCDQ